MDLVEEVVRGIVQQCTKAGVPVSETLAAFVARMIVYDNPEPYSLDSAPKDEALLQLQDSAVSFLSQKDSPQLETLRMQAAFDSAYFGNRNDLEQKALRRGQQLTALQGKIVGVKPSEASAFDGRTSLYRQIFQYLLVHANVKNASGAVQTEVAAALESVFPRVGLKAFVALSEDEKLAQLEELADLILGIRVFNWDIGKGGAGITDLPATATDLSTTLQTAILSEQDQAMEMCHQYVDVLALPAGVLTVDGDEGELRTRWKAELANRRQLSAFLGTLSSDVKADIDELQGAVSAFRAELEDLQRLIGSRKSVPKEQVYPKFKTIAAHWLDIAAVHDRLSARAAVHTALSDYVPPTLCTLHLDTIRKARVAAKARVPHSGAAEAAPDGAVVGKASTPAPPAAATATAATSTDRVDGAGGSASASASADAEDSKTESGTGTGSGGDAGSSPSARAAASPAGAAAGDGGGGGTAGGSGDVDGDDDDDDDGPVRMSLNSPDVMHLLLEYQGYCSVSLASQGLLLSGDPTLGVVRYTGRCYIFSSEDALQTFMGNPSYYTEAVLTAAKKSPELVHLLQLQTYFPQASLSAIIRGEAPAGADADADGPPMMKDAATETPTHFVEKHIDPRYHWNEWDMRRQALRVANIMNSRTVGTQGDVSYFRRDNDSQVYLPRDGATQTGVSKGTNPPRMVRYIDGLRGRGRVPRPADDAGAGAGAGAGAAASEGKAAEEDTDPHAGKRAVAVSTYTFEV